MVNGMMRRSFIPTAFAGAAIAIAALGTPADGCQPVTPPATIDDRAVLRGDGMAFVVTLSCVDPKASIGYRLAATKNFAGPWRPYTGPFEAPADRRFIEVRTHRAGHEPAVTGALLGGE